MKQKNKHITVFEHQSIKLHQVINGVRFDELKLKALQNYYGENGVPYFSLIHNGVRFNEYVGAIQVGNTLVEVLPKADKRPNSESEEKKWRDILIDMMRAVGSFEIKSTSNSNLKIKPNSVLDLYFEMFIKEVEYLLNSGLVKKYHKTEGNVTALKGSLQFGKNIQQNITHQERFYVRYTTFDAEHQLHFILYKTIRLLQQINTNVKLTSCIGALLLFFPEMPEIKVTEASFNKIVFNRKTQIYKKAIDISRLLLLQYHPDVSKGRNDVLALMFDMNKLWEQFVLVSLRKNKEHETIITAQTSKYFWKPENGSRSKIRPDILIKNENQTLVLDTKWKNLNGYNPSPDDLRQMYVYHEYYGAKRVALVYPGNKQNEIKGTFFPTPTYKERDKVCSIISLAIPVEGTDNRSIVKTWQTEIKTSLVNWIESPIK